MNLLPLVTKLRESRWACLWRQMEPGPNPGESPPPFNAFSTFYLGLLFANGFHCLRLLLQEAEDAVPGLGSPHLRLSDQRERGISIPSPSPPLAHPSIFKIPGLGYVSIHQANPRSQGQVRHDDWPALAMCPSMGGVGGKTFYPVQGRQACWVNDNSIGLLYRPHLFTMIWQWLKLSTAESGQGHFRISGSGGVLHKVY